MHGGAIATMLDNLTACTLFTIAKEGFWANTGVTRNLSLTYLRPILMGAKVVVECEVVQAGKTLALIKGTVKRVEDGAICVLCEHSRVRTDHAAVKL